MISQRSTQQLNNDDPNQSAAESLVGCEYQCSKNENQERCVEDCEDYKNMVIIIEVTTVLGTLVICGLFILFLIRCRRIIRRQSRRKKMYKKIEMELGRVNNDFVDSQIANLKQLRWRFTFSIGNQSYEDEFQFRWKLKGTKNKGRWRFCGSGKDYKGTWECEGLLQFPQNDQLHFWMLKDYDDKKKAKQIGSQRHIIYKGAYDHDNKWFNGDWYYHKCQKQPNKSGIWHLKQIPDSCSLESEIFIDDIPHP